MFISEISIKNFRSFQLNKVLFNPGLNVIIGHNNAGKTNLINALQLIFDRSLQRLSIEDFNAGITDYSTPPAIEVSISIKESLSDDGNRSPAEGAEDKNVVYDWLTNETPPYVAQLTFRYFLPIKHHEEYEREISTLRTSEGTFKVQECRKLIEKKFLRKYAAAVYGGDPSREEKVSVESLDRFNFQFLDAIRDAERQMFFGNSTLLRDVLNYFLDYDVTDGQDFELLSPEKKIQLRERDAEFAEKANDLLTHLIARISKQEILAYAKATGADKGGKPDFDGEITEKQLLFVLRLIVEKQGFKLPIKNNGLGYNNLLFIALILAKMQMESSSYMGDNATIFPILAIEEPEAHLHPSMQYKFLKFLDQNINTQKQARQAFISTHSTQITAAVNLDSIICLYEDVNGNQQVSYPGKAFSSSSEDQDSKRYVQRFLDATKSNMLFADRVIFVEGLAEQLLLPCFAAYLKSEELLINAHTTIISVDGTTFKHFIKLFLFDSTPGNVCLHRKIVCITDADPGRKEKTVEDDNGRRTWKSCYPFELNVDTATFDYKPLAAHVENLHQQTSGYAHIYVATPISGTGKTLEYELAHFNPSCQLLLTDTFPKSGKNKKEILSDMMTALKDSKDYSEIQDICLHDDIKDSLTKSTWDDERKKKALVAACYHKAIESSKGEHAFYLEQQLRENLNLPTDSQAPFTVPTYIENLIKFITDQE